MELFFFQAEDGIRDLTVTGVQTCALPILIEDDMNTFMRAGLGAAIIVLALTANLSAQMRTGIESRFAVVNGVRLHYLIAGKGDRKSTRLNSSHSHISYAVFCLKKTVIEYS